MNTKRIKLLLLSLMLWTGTAQAQSSTGAEAPKWFVLRDQQSGYCQSVLLIQIQGIYRHGSGLMAGGPFRAKEQAEQHLRTLVAAGICAHR
jgi:hypothetical protein